VVPSAKIFFEEVRAAYEETAAALGLSGPTETELVLPVSTYMTGRVKYEIQMDRREGVVECSVSTETGSVILTVSIESLAIAAQVVEKRGGLSYSARNLKQLRKSLQGQAAYIEHVHPFLADDSLADELMRKAGAREWNKGS
jgi:hypothetical protein